MVSKIGDQINKLHGDCSWNFGLGPKFVGHLRSHDKLPYIGVAPSISSR